MCKLSSLINCAIQNTELLQAFDRQTNMSGLKDIHF